MKLIVTAIYDHATAAYLPPIYMKTRAEAVRAFCQAVDSEGHQFNVHAKDYSLVMIGEFDDSDANYTQCEKFCLITGLEAKARISKQREAYVEFKAKQDTYEQDQENAQMSLEQRIEKSANIQSI